MQNASSLCWFSLLSAVQDVCSCRCFSRTMYKLLRSTCLHCFHLKMAQKEVDKYTERLALLAQGKLTEAAAVITGGAKAAETAKSFVEAGEGENASGNVLKGKSMGQAKGTAPKTPLDGRFEITQVPLLDAGRYTE